MDPHQASAPLSAADQARLDTFAVEIAEDALGPFQEEGEGSWRTAQGRGTIIHPGALWFNFRSGAGGRGTLPLIKHLHQIDASAAMRFARKWLAEHPGEGRLAPSDPDERPRRSASERTPGAPQKFRPRSSGAARTRGRPSICISPIVTCRPTTA